MQVRYLSGEKALRKVTLINELNSPDQGMIHISRPLGRALLGAEEGDEIEVLVDSSVREAIAENVVKGKPPESAKKQQPNTSVE